MVKIIFFGLILFIVFICFFVLKLKRNNKFLIKIFASGNVIVAGRKRKGKDALFSHVIALRKKNHYSNIHYDIGANYHTDVVSVSDFNCGSNSFLNLIENDVKKFEPEMKTSQDFYISDGAIYLPSQEDSSLSKIYKGFPITYALSGHLYENNIHVNAQRFKRVWIKLREQADYYILVRRSFYLGLGLLEKVIYYEREETAYSEALPFNGHFLSSDRRKVARAEYEAINGVVKSFFVFIPKKHLKRYNTHELRYRMLKNCWNDVGDYEPDVFSVSTNNNS